MKSAGYFAGIAFLIAPSIGAAGEGSWNDLMRGSQVVVDHQPHNTGGPASDTEYLNNFGEPSWQRLADDFILTEATTIGIIRWWGFYHLDNPPVTEIFRIRVYGSRASDGLPDESSMLMEEITASQSRVATGRQIATGIAPHEYLYETTLNNPFYLAGNTGQWLEIVQLGDQSTLFRWEFSLGQQNGHAFINGGVDDWRLTTSVVSDTAYQLIAIPEPSTAGIMGLGGLLWISFRRRRACPSITGD